MSRTAFADFAFRSYFRRKLVNYFAILILIFAGICALVPLLSVFGYVLVKGVSAINWNFFVALVAPQLRPTRVAEIAAAPLHDLQGIEKELDEMHESEQPESQHSEDRRDVFVH